MDKIVVIGCGNVGKSYIRMLSYTTPYALDICLIDIDQDKVKGELLDLEQALILRNANCKLRIGTYEDCRDASIVVIAASGKEKSVNRMDDIENSSPILQKIALHLSETSFSGIVLVATNPVDIASQVVSHYLGCPNEKVIGVGTMLDTIRLKSIISKKLEIHPDTINAYVLGEHGDHSFVAWTNANIGLQNLKRYIKEEEKEQIEKEIREMGGAIASLKGSTTEGVSSCLVTLTNTILNDERRIFPLSHYIEDYDIYISTPVIIGKDGILDEIVIKLSQDEEEKLKEAIQFIKEKKDTILPCELY